MERPFYLMQDELEEIRERADVLYSTLLAIYVALKENIFDGTSYTQAIHGTVHLAKEIIKELQAVQEFVLEKES